MFDILSREAYLGQTHLTQRWMGREQTQLTHVRWVFALY